MTATSEPTLFRILIVDDDPLVQRALARILTKGGRRLAMQAAKGASEPPPSAFEIELVSQGQEGFDRVTEAHEDNRPFALAFIDVRMPPGWDGIETTERIWKIDPDIQVVICTAHTDYTWADIVGRLGQRDNYLVLKKPFDNVEVLQLAYALTQKWSANRHARFKLTQVEAMARERTRELDVAYQSLKRETKEREQLEVELHHAHKLEAVGQLASGIAHELNTPAQFIGDNVRFLEEAFRDVNELLDTYDSVYRTLRCEGVGSSEPEAIVKLKEKIDLGFLKDQIPQAIDGVIEGVERISRIVRGMRAFAHRDGDEKSVADINRAIETALDVCRNEYRYVADVGTELGDIPLVPCNIGDLSQVFLNLIVNSAHAIEDKYTSADKRGTITIRTEQHGSDVLIAFQDDGCGIPEAVRHRLYEPFFTTKAVDRGTGQGLAIAHNIIVKQHGGALVFESEEGVGTTFIIRLPI